MPLWSCGELNSGPLKVQEVLLTTETSLPSLAIFLIAMTKITWEKATSKGGKAYLGFQFEERASFTVGNSWPQKHVAVAHIHRKGQVGLDVKPSRPPPSGCLPSAMLDLRIPQPCETQSPAGI